MNRRVELALYAVSALLLAGTAGIWWRGIRPSPTPPGLPLQPAAVIQEAGQPGPSKEEEEPASIFVHIAGAVERPGVYRLKEGQRLFEALDLVGLSENADVTALNLASPLRDSQKVYVPAKGETAPPHIEDPAPGASGGPGGAGTSPVSFPIDVNSATQSELEELPGIGPVLAGAILARRAEVGPFERTEDLQDVPGIGPKVFAKIAPFVTAK